MREKEKKRKCKR